MSRALVVGACLLVFGVSQAARAQDAVLAELYGQGVHAFFANNYRVAHDHLTSAIEQGSRDPRAYYFRGLTYAMLGRPDEAVADYKAGAALEAGAADRIYPVADSLQRVQGRLRVQLEEHRRIARLASHARALAVQKARYEELKRREADVLRNPGAAGMAPAAPGVTPPPSASDPFAGAPVEPETAPALPAEAPVEPAPAAADPFGAPAAPAAPVAPGDATTNPFGDDNPAGAPSTPAAPMAEMADPFGD